MTPTTPSAAPAGAVERLREFYRDRASFGFAYGGEGYSNDWDALMKRRAAETVALLDTLTAPPAQQRGAGEVVEVPREFIETCRLLASTLDGGFIACGHCGEQETTSDIDFAPDFIRQVAALFASTLSAATPSNAAAEREEMRVLTALREWLVSLPVAHTGDLRQGAMNMRSVLLLKINSMMDDTPDPQDQGARGEVVWQPLPVPDDGTWFLVSGGVAHWHEGKIKTLTGEQYPGRVIEWPVLAWAPVPKHQPSTLAGEQP